MDYTNQTRHRIARAGHDAGRRCALSDRGRLRAILVSLEQRWDGLNAQQRAHALELLADLAACYRQRDVCALKIA